MTDDTVSDGLGKINGIGGNGFMRLTEGFERRGTGLCEDKSNCSDRADGTLGLLYGWKILDDGTGTPDLDETSLCVGLCKNDPS